MRKPANVSGNLFPVLMKEWLFLIAVGIGVVGCSDYHDQHEQQVTKNVSVYVHDQSLTKENTSIEITIDEQIVWSADSIVNLSSQDLKLDIDTGIHVIQVRSLQDSFPMIDSIRIGKPNQRYILSVNFIYNPPVEWWNEYVVQDSYRKSLKKNNLNQDTVIPWLLDSIRQNVTKENQNNPSIYKPTTKHFEIKFQEQPLLE